jgi:hypothetical protein
MSSGVSGLHNSSVCRRAARNRSAKAEIRFGDSTGEAVVLKVHLHNWISLDQFRFMNVELTPQFSAKATGMPWVTSRRLGLCDIYKANPYLFGILPGAGNKLCPPGLDYSTCGSA